MANGSGHDKNNQSSVHRLDFLLQQIETIPDPKLREVVGQIIAAIMELHGAGLCAILERIWASGETGQNLIDEIARQEPVSSLLLLHGLHPIPMETRVKSALEKVLPYLHSHGGNVELSEITDSGIVKLKMQGSCHGCPSSAITLKTAIEQAIYEAAPDVAGIEVVNGSPPPTTVESSGFVPIERLTNKERLPQGAAS